MQNNNESIQHGSGEVSCYCPIVPFLMGILIHTHIHMNVSLFCTPKGVMLQSNNRCTSSLWCAYLNYILLNSSFTQVPPALRNRDSPTRSCDSPRASPEIPAVLRFEYSILLLEVIGERRLSLLLIVVTT